MLGNAQVGTINLAWRWLSGSDSTLVNVYSYGGVIWHMMQYSTPFIFLFVVDAFRAMILLEESSRMSGASRWQTFWRITCSLMLPVITSAFILSSIRGIESFELAVFFGTPVGIEVCHDRDLQLDHRACTARLPVGHGAQLRRPRPDVPAAGDAKPPAARPELHHRDRQGLLAQHHAALRRCWVTFGVCIVFFVLTVALPIGQLLLSSFFKFFGFYEADMLTLEHYRSVWENSAFWRAFGNTMLLGSFVGATITMALGGIVAYVTTRTRWRGRRLIDLLACCPR